MAGPLTGVRVVEVAGVVSVPWATMMLADQGADVIKIEPPGTGDILRHAPISCEGMSAFFANCNRGKRSVALDLTHPEGRAAALAIVAGADVFIENHRPGVLGRLGLGEPDLRAVRPDLVHVSVTGYGPDGPYADGRIYDPIIQGLTGHIAVQVNPDIPFPDLVRTIVCDKATALTAAQSICAALFARERGAGGQHIEIPMLDAALAFFWPDGMMGETFLADDVKPGWTLAQVYRLTETADGHLVYFTVGDNEMVDLLLALGREDLAVDPTYCRLEQRVANFEQVGTVLAAEFRKWKTTDILERLRAHGVAAGPVLSLDEVFDDPQVVHNQVVRVRTHPAVGPMREARPPARYSVSQAGEMPLAPVLGQHTAEILAEIGYDADRIGTLRAAGVLG
ncbi:MAG TPA: CaiB/BaiF CoA-transferase family protein [Acidimicrobiia bacterium]|nr:CaiB/BaiF CoA-transferase family protein [Acidimicrobiia bacterium]